MSRLDDLIAGLRPLRDRLLTHPLYLAIDGPAALRVFMEHHVYAVWDFMTLLKALQRRLTCVDLPWVPRGDRLGRRLVNEIVLAEESDDDGRGGFASHFELYRDAMAQAGADTTRIACFLDLLALGMPPAEALGRSQPPPPAVPFVLTTWRIVESGSAPAIASAFTLGREDLIPDLFHAIVARLDAQAPGHLDLFRLYLERHMHLDADVHGPMALRLLETLCGDDPSAWREAEAAAHEALEARLALWDGIAASRPLQIA